MDSECRQGAPKMDVTLDSEHFIDMGQIKPIRGLRPSDIPPTPLEGYPWFPLGEEVGSLGAWERDGDMTCGKFAPCGMLAPLLDLTSRLGKVPMLEWRYHQLVCIFNKLKPLIRPSNSLTVFESMCVHTSNARQMYRLVFRKKRKTVPYFIRDWEGELKQGFTTAQIKELIDLTHSTSISSQVQEMSYRFWARWYRTQVRLAQMYPTVDARYWRGCGQKGTLLHLWWSCPKINVF